MIWAIALMALIWAIALMALIWAAWHLAFEWMQRTRPILPEPHCCACEQFNRKCDAMESGVSFVRNESR